MLAPCSLLQYHRRRLSMLPDSCTQICGWFWRQNQTGDRETARPHIAPTTIFFLVVASPQTIHTHRQNDTAVRICRSFVHTVHGRPSFFCFCIFQARVRVSEASFFYVLCFLRESTVNTVLFNACGYESSPDSGRSWRFTGHSRRRRKLRRRKSEGNGYSSAVCTRDEHGIRDSSCLVGRKGR